MNNPAIVPGYVQHPLNLNPPQHGWSCAKRIASVALSALLGLGSLLALPFPFSLLGGALASIILLKWGFKDEENRQNLPAPILMQNPIRNEHVVAPVFDPQPPVITFWGRAFNWMQAFNYARVRVANPGAREEVGDGHVNRVVVEQPRPVVPVVPQMPGFRAPAPNPRPVIAFNNQPREHVGDEHINRVVEELVRPVAVPVVAQMPVFRGPAPNPQPDQRDVPNARNVHPGNGYAGGEPRREIPRPPLAAPPRAPIRNPEHEEVGQRR